MGHLYQLANCEITRGYNTSVRTFISFGMLTNWVCGSEAAQVVGCGQVFPDPASNLHCHSILTTSPQTDVAHRVLASRKHNAQQILTFCRFDQDISLQICGGNKICKIGFPVFWALYQRGLTGLSHCELQALLVSAGQLTSSIWLFSTVFFSTQRFLPVSTPDDFWSPWVAPYHFFGGSTCSPGAAWQAKFQVERGR